MMNGEVESSHGTVTDLPSEVVEKSNEEEFVSATHEKEEESSHEAPDDLMPEIESAKEEIADVDAMSAGGGSQDEASARGSEIPLNSEDDRLPEDVFRKSVELDVLEELRNGHPEARCEEVEILDSCSSEVPNGTHEVLEEESGDVDPVPFSTSQTEEATGGSEVPLEIENDGLQEDTSLQSVASDVTEKLPNGHPEVEIGDSESRSIESGDGNAVTASTCPDDESAGGLEIPLDAAIEDVSLPSAPLDVAEDLPNGHSQVEDEKVDIHESPKTAVPILSGWAEAVIKGRLPNVETVPTAVTPQIEESIRDPEVLEIPEKDLLPEDVCPQSVAPEVTEERPSGIEEVENKEVECPEDTCNTAIPQTRPTCSSSPETSKEQIDIGDSLCDNESSGGLELPLHPEDQKLSEDVSPELVSAEKTEELPNGHIGTEIRKPDISDGWNSGSTSGWASADPPGEESSSIPAEVGLSTSGVLGSAPAPVDVGTEQPTLQRYTYYMIKIPRPVDDKGKADISNAESKLQEKADERDQHNVHVQAAKKKRNEAFEKMKAAGAFERECLQKLRAKYDEVKPLRDSIKTIKADERNMRERNHGMPRSEEDLNYRIATLERRIQHETNSLVEEKQLVRDIKALEACRESVRQNAAQKQQVQESLGNLEEIEEALKPLNVQYRQLEVEYKAAVANKLAAEKEYDTLNEAYSSVMGQMHKANDSRQEAYEVRRALKQQEYARLKEFYDNKREIQTAKDMASQPKSRQAVEELCNGQVERIMELWNSNEEFRKNYVKDNERSTIRRLETLDGRALGPGEKAPTLSVPSRVAEQKSNSSATESGRQSGNTGGEATEEAGVKKVKAPVKKGSEAVVATSTEKTVSKEERRKETSAVPEVAEPVVVEKSQEEIEREAAELKEKRRAAEMAKAKEAEERKRRLAERSQLKAQAWAQREAERKEKEKEKKSRKKSATVNSVEAVNLSESAPDAEGNKSGPDVDEPVVEQTNVNVRRKRGVTVSQKTVTKAAVESPSLARVRRKSQHQKVFGLPLQTVVVMSSAAVAVLVPISIFLLR